MPAASPTTPGDADLARIGDALAEPARARIVLALADGRALPASLLAAEAGVAPSTTSKHLQRLVAAGLLVVHPQGRHRYYALAGPEVGALIEVAARLAPPRPVRSLREGTRAAALRRGRTCYDHLAGRLGVDVFGSLIDCGHVTGGDGRHVVGAAGQDRLSAPGRDVDYRLTPRGRDALAALGVALPEPRRDEGAGLPLRYCVDWSEQRHHLSGPVGRALADRLFELRWLRRAGRTRAVHVTPEGERGLREAFGISAAARGPA